MTGWCSKEIGDGVEAYAPAQTLFTMVQAIAKSNGVPRNFAVFSRYDLHRNLVTWYFSPEAEPIAVAFDATKCSIPIPEPGFCLLTGDPGAWEHHFPGYLDRTRRDEF